MTDRAKVLESVQIGLEATPGTAVAAPTNVRAMSVDMKIPAAAEFFRPDGHKFNTLSTLNMEWSTWAINGKPTYTEICYLLAAMFGNPAPTTVGTLGRKRVYDMADAAAGNPKTLTIMKGSSVRAQKIAYGLLHDLGFTFSRSAGLTVTGQGIGQLFTDGITMTASPSDVALIPLVGKQLDCYVDATAANLGTTQMLRAFTMDASLTGVYGPLWAINSSLASYAAHIDLAPTTAVKLVLEADAAGMAYLSQFRSDDQIFVRMQATGPTIETIAGTPPTPNPYSFIYDVCLGIKTVTPDNDDQGVTVVEFDCEMVQDSTWTKALEITDVNAIASIA